MTLCTRHDIIFWWICMIFSFWVWYNGFGRVIKWLCIWNWENCVKNQGCGGTNDSDSLFRCTGRIQQMDVTNDWLKSNWFHIRNSSRNNLKKSKLKPWLVKEWCIPKAGAEFVAAMEDVLDELFSFAIINLRIKSVPHWYEERFAFTYSILLANLSLSIFFKC